MNRVQVGTNKETDPSGYQSNTFVLSRYCSKRSLVTLQSMGISLSITTPRNIWSMNPSFSPIFTTPMSYSNSKFFVIKSYNLQDVRSSYHHKIWSSTNFGNQRLNKAFLESERVFLFFSVNGSGHYCGMAEMISRVDFNIASDIWQEKSRWKGVFQIKWLEIKDIPSKNFNHLLVPSNNYKPVTCSRDTQELPMDVGISMMRIFQLYLQQPT
ncbi:hypothetical protein CAAN3_04S01904 [[Candida] anglica]